MKASPNTSFRWLYLPLVLLLACAGAFAQQNSLISGSVQDKAGAAVSGAAVTLTQTATGYVSKAVSNDSGYFTFPALNPGAYDLSVSAKGFKTYVTQGLQVNVSQNLHVDAALEVGNVDQTVTVTADELTVQTDSNVVSTLVSADQISESQHRTGTSPLLWHSAWVSAPTFRITTRQLRLVPARRSVSTVSARATTSG